MDSLAGGVTVKELVLRFSTGADSSVWPWATIWGPGVEWTNCVLRGAVTA